MFGKKATEQQLECLAVRHETLLKRHVDLECKYNRLMEHFNLTEIRPPSRVEIASAKGCPEK